MKEYSRDELKALIRPLTDEQEVSVGYYKHPFAELCTVASPEALLKRAEFIRTHGRVAIDAESTAAHLELAAETISMLWRFL